MGSHTVGFDSYVEIAVCMANQDSDIEILKQSVGKSTQNPAISWSAEDFGIQSPHFLKTEWRERIREWKERYPDNGNPVEDTPLAELEFGTLFLQHPFAAMSLRNVMQRFYALDRLVCSTSKESLERIREWEDMPPFKYLEAGKVEKSWRSSLKELGKEIKEISKQVEEPLPEKANVLSSFAEKRQGSEGVAKLSNERSKSETLLRRIDGIYSGIAKLDTSLRELRRNLKEYLENENLVENMLKRIVATAGIRYSMIDTYLKMDENNEGGDYFDHHLDHAEFADDTTSHSWQQKADFCADQEPRRFKPLSRTNSMDLVKNKLVIAWVSTRRGDATASAILLLIIILGCLIQIQKYLIAGSEIRATTFR